jgi:putative NADH-flavin reductase
VEKLNKVLVTGGTGFIGTKLVTELVRKGHIIHVLKRPTSDTEGLEHERIHLFTGDLIDCESIRKAMGDEPRFIISLPMQKTGRKIRKLSTKTTWKDFAMYGKWQRCWAWSEWCLLPPL